MQIKIHKSYRTIVALADTDLSGKTFEEGKMQLDLTGEFFKGEEKNKEEVIEILKDMQKEDATFNIVGKESVECALKSGIIDKEGIKKVQEIPFALILL